MKKVYNLYIWKKGTCPKCQYSLAPEHVIIPIKTDDASNSETISQVHWCKKCNQFFITPTKLDLLTKKIKPGKITGIQYEKESPQPVSSPSSRHTTIFLEDMYRIRQSKLKKQRRNAKLLSSYHSFQLQRQEVCSSCGMPISTNGYCGCS